MKKSVLAISLVAFPQAMLAGEPYELEIPSLSDQYDQAQKEILDQTAEVLRTDPYMAGSIYTLYHKGEVYRVVDRRGEVAKPVGSAGLSRMSLFINGLSAEARAQLRIQVKFNADGSEEWNVAFDANWQAQTGMNDAMGKAHK